MSGLQVSGVVKSFGGVSAVRGVDLSVGDKEIVGLIGPNGAGKTTLFNLISGYYHPDQGNVVFDDHNLAGLQPWEIVRRGIARTFQNIQLLDKLSVITNILVGLHCRTSVGLWDALRRNQKHQSEETNGQALARELLDLVGLSGKHEWAAGSLSYGEQRRLEVARALATSPNLLMLDEPGAGMAASEIDTLVNLIRLLKESRSISVLLISHDMRMVMALCDRIVVLHYGEKIAEGLPSEVRVDPKVREVYLGRRRDGKDPVVPAFHE